MTHGKKRETEDAACRDLNAIKKTERFVVIFVAARSRRNMTTSPSRSNFFPPLLFFHYYVC